MVVKSRLSEMSRWLDVQKKSKDTVVQIFSQILNFNWLEPYRTPQQSMAFGTGFFISKEGYLVTNFHVIDEAINIKIQIPSLGKQKFEVEVVGVYPEMDIALLKLKDKDKKQVEELIGDITFLEFGNSDDVFRTQEILALGYPLGQESLKSTQGIVSGREKMQMISYIQMTAPLNPGNSGGPSINKDGEVIGINFAGVLSAQNVGYIIPINEVKYAIKDLQKLKLLRRPYLGGIFSISNIDMVRFLGNPDDGGFYIAKVFPKSILDRTGVKEGDMIYEINGHHVDRYGEISAPWSEDKISIFDFLNRQHVGDKMSLVLYRKGEKKECNFKFERGLMIPIRFVYPKYEEIDYEVFGGIVLMNLTLNHVGIFAEKNPLFSGFYLADNQQKSRLVVTNILLDSQAQQSHSVLPGDILAEVNGIAVSNVDDFRKAVVKKQKNGFATLKTGSEIFTVLSIDKVLEDEERLSKQYKYKKPKFIDLMNT